MELSPKSGIPPLSLTNLTSFSAPNNPKNCTLSPNSNSISVKNKFANAVKEIQKKQARHKKKKQYAAKRHRMLLEARKTQRKRRSKSVNPHFAKKASIQELIEPEPEHMAGRSRVWVKSSQEINNSMANFEETLEIVKVNNFFIPIEKFTTSKISFFCQTNPRPLYQPKLISNSRRKRERRQK